MQRAIYLSTFSVTPGFSLASNAMIELLSTRAFLMIDLMPKVPIRFPEMSIALMYLS